VHRGDLADVDGDEDDAGEGAPIVEIRNVGGLTSEAIKRFDYDHIEEAAIEVGIADVSGIFDRDRGGSGASSGTMSR
jgi:hypothetical protein